MRTGLPRRLILTLKEQRQLEAWTSTPATPAGLQRRSRALLLAAAGVPIRTCAERVGLSRQQLHLWLARFQHEGLAGLQDRARRCGDLRRYTGRPRTCLVTLTPHEQRQLETWARARAIPASLQRRSQAVLLAATPLAITTIAQRVGRSRQEIYRWLTRFQEQGLHGLLSTRYGGG